MPSLLRAFLIALAWVLIPGSIVALRAQEGAPTLKPAPSARPTPAEEEQRGEQDQIKVFTEEVRLPVMAYDDYGHYDPTLEMRDLLILEDQVAQEIRSVRRIPANVLLLLDTDSQMTVGKDLGATRATALRLIASLREADQVAVVQFGDGVKVLQDWTIDRKELGRALKTKLHSGKRGRLSEAVAASVEALKDKPAGSRHVVLITDGVETPGSKTNFAEAFKRLSAAQTTVHVISYTALVRGAVEQRYRRSVLRRGRTGPVEANPGGDPTMPPGNTRNPSYRIFTIDLDNKSRERDKRYAAETYQSEQRLTSLAEETGGRILLPESTEKIARAAEEVARDIGAQYIVTYTPKRPLASPAAVGEYRRVEVVARRAGLNLRSRRGYVVKSAL